MTSRGRQTSDHDSTRAARQASEHGKVADADGMSLAKPASLSELAKGSLRARIITGEIAAGKIYSVPSLAAAFGVSATPVREALVELASDGLVEVVANQGFRVVELSKEDLDHIFQVRVMLEVPGMVEVARSSPSSAELSEYARLAQDIERFAGEGESVGYLGADRAFHLGLISKLGNERLVQIVAELRDQARLYGLRLLIERGELMDSAHEHAELVDAISRRDLKAVRTISRYHIEHTRDIWAHANEGRL